MLNYIIRKYDISPKVAPLLIKKGMRTKELVDIAFKPEIELLTPPHTLPDFNKAISLILSKKNKILIWGHEDGDGVTSTVVLYRALTKVGYKVNDYIPSKSEEGHGLSFTGIDKALKEEIKLILTVDCGSTNLEEIKYAQSKGIRVIITDHHELPKTLPPVPVVNPKRKGGSFPYLAGVGVAFKLALGILEKLYSWTIKDVRREMPELFVFTAVGTQTDRVPLISENRALYKEGLSLFKKLSLPLFEAYQELRNREIDWDTFVSLIASGKSTSGKNNAVKLLLASTKGEVIPYLEEMLEAIEVWNREAESVLENALAKIKRVHKYILLDLGETNPHYLGFVASKLKDRFEVPVIVLGRKYDGKVVAEIRTPYGINSLSLLDFLSYLFEDYGGHRQASGFSMNPSHLAAFVEGVEMFFRESKESEGEKEVDLRLETGEDGKIIEDLERLGKLGLEGRILWKNPPQEVRDRFSSHDSKYLLLRIGENGVVKI